MEQKCMTDMYGEAEVDEYDELYGFIQDKYQNIIYYIKELKDNMYI